MTNGSTIVCVVVAVLSCLKLPRFILKDQQNRQTLQQHYRRYWLLTGSLLAAAEVASYNSEVLDARRQTTYADGDEDRQN